jgi:HPt (histidine-containing phosphotransfer) domain-containing protein
MEGQPSGGIEFQKLLDRLDGDAEFLSEIVSLFVTDAPGTAEQLSTAVVNHDDPKVEKHAHSLKGTAATVRADKLQELSFRLEMAAKDANRDEYQDLLSAITAELQIIRRQAQDRGIGYK